MPAETHQLSERTGSGAGAVLDLLIAVLGIDGPDPAQTRLADLELDDDLSILDLWDVAVNEFGERALGDLDPALDLEDERPATLGELAELFDRALQPAAARRGGDRV